MESASPGATRASPAAGGVSLPRESASPGPGARRLFTEKPPPASSRQSLAFPANRGDGGPPHSCATHIVSSEPLGARPPQTPARAATPPRPTDPNGDCDFLSARKPRQPVGNNIHQPEPKRPGDFVPQPQSWQAGNEGIFLLTPRSSDYLSKSPTFCLNSSGRRIRRAFDSVG